MSEYPRYRPAPGVGRVGPVDNRIIIIAASVAFVALVAGGSYYFCHDDNIYLKSLDDKDGCASAFSIINTDKPGVAEPMKQGAVVFTNTTMVSHSTDELQWQGSPYYDDQRECIVSECLFEGEGYVFNMDLKKAGKVADLYVSGGSMVIRLEGVERGFSLDLTMSSDKLSDALVGDWKVGSAHEGWFTNGDIEYGPSETNVNLSIRKATGLLYRLTYNGDVSYCAWNFGTAYASNYDRSGATGYIRPDGQDLVMTSVMDGGIGSVIRFESTDRDHQAPSGPVPDAAAGEVPAAGTSWDAVKAYEIEGVTETDILDRGYNFTMLRVEGDLIFYRVASSIDDFHFVAVRAAQGFWLSAADEETDFKSMAYFEPGVLYASYYEGGSKGALYSIIFGDAEAVKPMDRSLVGKPYNGSQHSVEFMDGKVLDGPGTSDVSLSFIRQYGNVAMAETEAGLVDAKWSVAIQVSKPEGYLFMVEASAERFGEEFHGYYIGLIAADLSKISLSGALVRDDGDAAAFTQELYPSLKRSINASRRIPWDSRSSRSGC